MSFDDLFVHYDTSPDSAVLPILDFEVPMNQAAQFLCSRRQVRRTAKNQG